MSEEDGILKCPICYEDYDETHFLPRILPCHHSLCHPCLQTFIQQTRRQFNCPVCRQRHIVGPTGVLHFPQNQYILACIKMKSVQVEKVVLVEPFPRCAVHNREMTLFCENKTCKQILCPRCKHAEHSDHKVVEIEDKQEECLKIVNETTEYINERTKELTESRTNVDKDYDVSLALIDNTREALVKYVNHSLDVIRKKIEKHKKTNLKQITDCIIDFTEK